MKTYLTLSIYFILTFCLFSCGSTHQPIEQTLATKIVAKTNYTKVSETERFGIRMPPILSQPHDEEEAHDHGTPEFEYVLPATWQEGQSIEGRQINLTIKNQPDLSCYLTLLPSRGGDALMNLNRWRGQFQQPSLTNIAEQKNEEVSFFNISTKLFEISGNFKTQDQIHNNYTMLGLITKDEHWAYSIKFVGPSENVLAEKNNFLLWVSSLHPKPASKETPNHTTKESKKLSWVTPKDWQQDTSNPQRIATFKPNGKAQTECTVTSFGGSVLENLNRWRKQLGQEPISDLEKENHEWLDTSIGKCYFVIIEGPYNGGMGGQAIATAQLIGGILSQGETSIFIKLIGPKNETSSEVDAIKSFIQSLKE